MNRSAGFLFCRFVIATPVTNRRFGGSAADRIRGPFEAMVVAAAGGRLDVLAGPACLGRGVLVSPGQAPPGVWADAERVVVNAAALDSGAGRVLRDAWSSRRRVVIEMHGPVPGPGQTIHRRWWDLHPGVTLGSDVWHHLLTANTVDARDLDRPGFVPAAKAEKLGAGLSRDVGDVVNEGRAVWCDGGPLDSFEPDALGGLCLVPAVNIAAGSLRTLRHCEPVADLAPDQRRAVAHLGGGASVVAPAGSGKTRVLTERVRWLVDGLGVSAAAVCLVAYNVRARAEMAARTTDLHGLEVRTLNSLALAICNGSGPFVRPQTHRTVSVINESGVRDLLQDLIAGQGTKKRRKAMTDPLAAWVEALGTTRLGLRPPAEVEADYAPDVTGFADIAPQYAQALHERDVVDFDHQIIRAIEVLLTDTRARFAARRVCGTLLVDEFQDLTPAHLLLLRIVAGPPADVFGVGDDDQTIYGYSGASPRWLIDYDQWFPRSQRHVLHVNYRCPPAVVEAASNVLSHNKHRITKNITSRSAHPNPGNGTVSTRNVDDTGAAVLERVDALLAGSVDAADIAVLARVNSTLLAPQIALKEAGIECMTPVGPWFLERTGVAAALSWLALSTNDKHLSAAALSAAARRPPRGISPRVVDWICEQRDLAALRRLAQRISDARTSQKVTELADDIEHLAMLARGGANTGVLLETIRDSVGLGASLDERLDASRRTVDRSAHGDDLRALLSVAPHCENPAQFQRWLAERLQPPPDTDTSFGRAVWGPGVRLATVHKVKGLEWPHVIVLSAIEGLMPHRLASDIEEERRVFHVAITRCSESVLILCDGPASLFVAETSRRHEPIATTPKNVPAAADPRWWLHHKPAWTQPAPAGHATNNPQPATTPIDADTEPETAEMFQRLRDWRRQRSQKDAVPAYVLFADATLEYLARERPTTDEALLAIPGIGPAKLVSYGAELKDLLS